MLFASAFSDLGTFLGFCFLGLLGIGLLIVQQMSYDPAVRDRNLEYVRRGVDWWNSRQ